MYLVTSILLYVFIPSGPGQFRAGDLPPARGPGQGQGQEASPRVLSRRPQRRHRHLPAAPLQVSPLFSPYVGIGKPQSQSSSKSNGSGTDPLKSSSSYSSLYRAGSGGPDTIAATGLAMLFSAGTFLYVATVHVLPEVTSGHGHSVDKGDKAGFSKSELAMLILGAVAPLFLSIGHHH